MNKRRQTHLVAAVGLYKAFYLVQILEGTINRFSFVQVADFLRDEHTVTAATTAFGRLLFCAAVANTNSTASSREASVSEADAHVLMSLGPQLAGRAMRAMGSLACCLHHLPRCCHSVAVAAAISDSSTLTLGTAPCHGAHRSCTDHVEAISSALRDLPSRVLSLKVCSLTDGDWVGQLLPSLPGLQCLEVSNSHCSVPARVALQNLLPALTRLQLSCVQERALDLRDRFTSRLGKLSLLKVCCTLTAGLHVCCTTCHASVPHLTSSAHYQRRTQKTTLALAGAGF